MRFNVSTRTWGPRLLPTLRRLKLMQDADAIAADCADLAAHHGLDPATTRKAIEAMLADQPVPLRGG
jgi:heterodisulfide reductase subunit D